MKKVFLKTILILWIVVIITMSNVICNKKNSTIEKEQILVSKIPVSVILPGKAIKINKPIIITKLEFNHKDVTLPSNATPKQLDLLLKDTGLSGIGASYVEAEKLYKINALFLVGITATESTWGTSDMAKLKNNISGFSAYNDSPMTSSRGFDSFGQCIMRTAQLIRENYLETGGESYNGLATSQINIRYSLNDDKSVNYKWSEIVNDIAYGLIRKSK